MSTKNAATPKRYRPTRRPNPLGAFLGMKQYVRGPGEGLCRLKVRHEFFNPVGTVHGGILFTMIDNDMGAAINTTIGAEERASTVEVKINFLKPVVSGELVSTTQVLQRGRRIAVLESRLHQGRTLIAVALGTYAISARTSK
jgi:acyl-CoA thioesterase